MGATKRNAIDHTDASERQRTAAHKAWSTVRATQAEKIRARAEAARLEAARLESEATALETAAEESRRAAEERERAAVNGARRAVFGGRVDPTPAPSAPSSALDLAGLESMILRATERATERVLAAHGTPPERAAAPELEGHVIHVVLDPSALDAIATGRASAVDLASLVSAIQGAVGEHTADSDATSERFVTLIAHPDQRGAKGGAHALSAALAARMAPVAGGSAPPARGGKRAPITPAKRGGKR